MWNRINDRRILQSSKNSTALLKNLNYTNKKNNQIKNRKNSNEKYKTQIINQIYNKLFSFSNNLPNISNNSIINKSNYNNFINPNKRNIKKNLIRNSQNNKSLNHKKNIPLPMRKNNKEQLKIKTKLYCSYMSNDLSKNYLKQTNNTTDINMSLNDNNFTEEKYEKEKKKENKNNENKNENIKNNSNDNLISINIKINSGCKNKKNIKNIKNAGGRKLSNSNFLKKQNNELNEIKKTNINYKKIININDGYKKKNNNKKEIREEKNTELHLFKKEKNKEKNKNTNELKQNKIKVPKRMKNNIFNTFKDNKPNYYFLVVSGNKLDRQNNNKDKSKYRNFNHNLLINNNRTYYIEKIPYYIDKIDLSPISNLIGDSTLKLTEPYKQILIVNNDEINKKSLNDSNLINNEQLISERKSNKYKNIIINQNILNKENYKDKNKTIYKKNKILKNYKNSYLKLKEEQKNKPNSQNILKKYKLDNDNDNDKDRSLQKKTYRKINKNINSININNKENRISNLDIKNNSNSNKYLKTINKYKIKNSNSNVTILDNNKQEKFNINYYSNKTNNNNLSTNLKSIYSNKKENKTTKIKSNKNLENNNNKNDYNDKNDLNKNYFENFKEDNNNISIFLSEEDDKTDKQEEETENSPRINKLVTYFNDAKKTLKNSNLFYKNDNAKTFLEVISPNKSTIINPNNNKIEEDELSNNTIKVPIFMDVSLLNNLLENNMNNKNINGEIKNLYDLISKLNNFKPKKYLLSFLDDKSLMILSTINRQFYINLRILFYNNIYTKILNDKKNIFINKIKSSMFSYASNKIKNLDNKKLKEIYESFGNKKSIYDDLIIKDINRTFPYDLNFQKNSLKYFKLYNLLTRYSNYNTSIGYAQGLNFIFANAISYFDKEEDVFIFIDGLINLFKIENFMGENNSTLTLQIKKYSNIISKYIPDIIKYLEKKLLTHDFFSTGWILTLFSNAMNNKNLMITWCFMIVFGWKFFYCFVIKILTFYKDDIYKTSENNLSKKMKKLLKEERFNNDIKKIINNTLHFMSQNIVL